MHSVQTLTFYAAKKRFRSAHYDPFQLFVQKRKGGVALVNNLPT